MTSKILSFEKFQTQWEKEHNLQFDMDKDNEPKFKRNVQSTSSPVFTCDHCQEQGKGTPFELPDPTGEVGPQGSFCSRECAKSVALYEVGRDDIANLIDGMAGCVIEPAAPWTQLKVVRQTDGLTREDWADVVPMDEENNLQFDMQGPKVLEGTGMTKKNKNEISI